MGIRVKDTFKKIIEYIFEEYDIDLINRETIVDRFSINYDSGNEYEGNLYLQWRKNGKIIFGDKISYYIKYSVLEIDDIYYLVIQNFQDKFKLKFLTEVELNLGMFLYLFNEQKYYPMLNLNLEEDDIVEEFDIIDKDYKYHKFDNIKNIFPNIRVFQISPDCPFDLDTKLKESIDRILALILVEKYRNEKRCYFKDDTLSKYEELIMEDIKYFPYENLLASLIESKSSKIFLEIYRIIERLYPYIMIAKLKNEMNISKAQIDVFKLEESLRGINWRHKEEDSINLLFEHLGDLECDKIKQLKESTSKNTSEISEKSSMKLGTWIYRIRNTIVHFSLKDTKNNVDVKLILESDDVINLILSNLMILYKYCFDDED